MKKLFMCLTFLSPLSFAGIPTIDVANLVENEVKPIIWATEELKAIGANVDDLDIIDFTFPCKVVYQMKSNKSVLVHITSDHAESTKSDSLCKNPVNLSPDAKTLDWAREEISLAGLYINAVEIVDITYPCKIVYKADSDLMAKLYLPESSKTNEACIIKPVPLSEAEQKRQQELTKIMDEARKNSNIKPPASSNLNSIVFILLFASAFLIFLLSLSRRRDKSSSDN